MPRYQLTFTADTLAELTGAVTEAAQTLQAGDAGRSLALELMPLAEPVAGPDTSYGPALPPDNGARPAAIPTPPPDYQAAGLTAWQEARVRMDAPAPIYVPPQAAVAVAPVYSGTGINAGVSDQPYAPPAGTVPVAPPQCRLGHGAMLWKGGGLSKNGKNLPLWSCEGDGGKCREAIWPPR